MKKLMVALGAVACAIAANASAVTWTSTTGTSATFLVDSTGAQIKALPTGTSIILVTLAGEDLAAYKAGTYSASYSSSAVLGTATINTSNMAAKKGQATGKFTFVYDESDTSNNPIHEGDVLCALITDGKSQSNISYYDTTKGMVTDYLTVADLDGDDAKKGLYDGTFNYATKGNFTSAVQSVPEPTSAMLLLLGVAGLALRRRRA